MYVYELSRALQALGCKVSVASGPPYPELAPGIELIELPSLDLFSTDNALLALRWRHLRNRADRAEWLAHNTGAFGEMTAFGERLDDFLAREHGRFDIVHDNQTLSAPMLRIARRLPLVTTLHHPIAIDREFAVAGASGFKDRLFTRRWYSFVEKQAATARRLTRFLAVSTAARDAYARLCGVDPCNVTVAHNGLDHQVFRTNELIRREKNLIVAAASADVPIKGLDVLINAFSGLAREFPDLRLSVIGALRDGPTKRALEAAGLSERVSFRSGLARREIADLHRRATLFVAPSRFEGFGFPAAEAMACGAPVIASDGGALPEVVGDAGIVTPAGDADALAAVIRALMKDPDARMRMGEAGAMRARRRFTWTAHAEAALSLYGATPARLQAA